MSLARGVLEACLGTFFFVKKEKGESESVHMMMDGICQQNKNRSRENIG